MAHAGSSWFTVPPAVPWGSEPELIVVWLVGEHDISTDGALCLTLARAIALQPAALVVDLSGVEFMGASTLKTIARARELVRGGRRSVLGWQCRRPSGPIGSPVRAAARPRPGRRSPDHHLESASPKRRPPGEGHMTKAALCGWQR
jgi:hypothetical protein